jgi:hypothetical protein
MPVDALLGIPDMSKLLNESKYEVNFKESPSINQGSQNLQIYYLLPQQLKDILTEKGFHTKSGKLSH